MGDEILDGVVHPGPPSPFSRVEFSPKEIAQLDAMTGQAPAPLTVEQLLEAARPLATRPQLGRLEVGRLAYAILKARFTPEDALPESPYRSLAISTSLYGVPLMMRGSMDPRAWRLLDTDGHIIKEGTL